MKYTVVIRRGEIPEQDRPKYNIGSILRSRIFIYPKVKTLPILQMLSFL